MQMHVVLYHAYEGNPYATPMIIRKAYELLDDTAIGTTFFSAGKVINTGRTVSNNDYTVMLVLGFKDSSDYALYMNSKPHMEFVRFVLRGWILRGSQATNPEEEFITHILRGTTKLKWERDPGVPDSQVVWHGEAVFDALG